MDWCRGDNSDQIAVEVPRENRENISLAHLMSRPEFKNSDAILPIVIGVDTLGHPIISDLSDMPHMLISGDNGTGKTMLLKSIARSIAARTTPDKCKVMILKTPDSELGGVIAEIDRRYGMLSGAGMAGVDMPRLVVIIDDLSDLMVASRGNVEKYLTQIAQKGRSVGVHIIVATAHCDAKTMSGTLKANFPTRISFHVDTAAKSRQTLGEHGAELLLPYGDALLSSAGLIPMRIHTPNIDG